jgi:rhamnulokinase
MQAIGLGYLRNIQHARQVVKNSFEMKHFEPTDIVDWENAYKRFLTIAKQN